MRFRSLALMWMALAFLGSRDVGAREPSPTAWGGTSAPQAARPSGHDLMVPPVPGTSAMQARPACRDLEVPTGLRVMVFAPHPDDELLAAGGLVQQVLARGGEVRVIYVTNGDGYEDGVRASATGGRVSSRDFVAYGQIRQGEARGATTRLGVEGKAVRFLGFPDDGIDDLWGTYWSSVRPYTSPHTRLDRPFQSDSGPQVEYKGVYLEGEIRKELERWSPEWVVVPDPRDTHPDHCATGLFVLDVLRQLARGETQGPQPVVLGYLVHAPDYPASVAWVRKIAQSGIGGSLVARNVLTGAGWVRLPLLLSQQERKSQALLSYRTQLRVMRQFLLQFVAPDELFSLLDGKQFYALPRESARLFGRKP